MTTSAWSSSWSASDLPKDFGRRSTMDDNFFFFRSDDMGFDSRTPTRNRLQGRALEDEARTSPSVRAGEAGARGRRDRAR